MAMRDLYVALGRRIADVRRAAGMSQAQVAAGVGTTQTVISRIERGAGVPSLARVADIADALHVHIGELFAFEREAPSLAAQDAVVQRFAVLVRRVSPRDAEVVLQVAEALARRHAPRTGRK